MKIVIKKKIIQVLKNRDFYLVMDDIVRMRRKSPSAIDKGYLEPIITLLFYMIMYKCDKLVKLIGYQRPVLRNIIFCKQAFDLLINVLLNKHPHEDTETFL